MRLWFVSFAFVYANALISVNPTETVPICVNENTVLSPLSNNVSTLTRIAWPISEPSFEAPITVNGVAAVEFPTIICMNCDDPPCYPITSCDVNNLYWSARFDNLVVQPGRMILPSTPLFPTTLVSFYTEGAPMPSPSPSPTPSATPSSSVIASASAVPPLIRPVPEPCDKSPTVGLSVSLFFVTAAAVVAIWFQWRANLSLKCVYCGFFVRKDQYKKHLFTCSEHLKLFSLVAIDTVKIVKHVEQEDREDEVARPETVNFVQAS
jgi:hypothetical protein